MFEFFTKAKKIKDLEDKLNLSYTQIYSSDRNAKHYQRLYRNICKSLGDKIDTVKEELNTSTEQLMNAIQELTNERIKNLTLQVEIEKLREENKLLKAVSENQVVQITELSENLCKPKSMAYIIWED